MVGKYRTHHTQGYGFQKPIKCQNKFCSLRVQHTCTYCESTSLFRGVIISPTDFYQCGISFYSLQQKHSIYLAPQSHRPFIRLTKSSAYCKYILIANIFHRSCHKRVNKQPATNRTNSSEVLNEASTPAFSALHEQLPRSCKNFQIDNVEIENHTHELSGSSPLTNLHAKLSSTLLNLFFAPIRAGIQNVLGGRFFLRHFDLHYQKRVPGGLWGLFRTERSSHYCSGTAVGKRELGPGVQHSGTNACLANVKS